MSTTNKVEMEKQNLDIVFLTLPRLELRTPITAPAILKATVEENGYKAFCFDLNIDLWHKLDPKEYGHIWFDTDLTFRHKDRFDEFWEEVIKSCSQSWIEVIREKDPKWVGLTIFSQRSKWISRALCHLLREQLPQVKIVCGGPFAEFACPSMYENGLIDAYVVGEGEEPIINILEGNFNNPGINGNPPNQTRDLNLIPIPDYDDFDFNLYPKTWGDPRVRDPEQMGSNFIYITGSRGCVRKCDFCDIQSIWPKFRYRSGENIAQEMRQQNQRYGSQRFLFTDSLLNGSVRQLKELCETLIHYREQGLMEKVKWQGQFIARPEKHMKEEVYALMKEAGCFFVSIGVESGSEKVRDDMKKQFDNDALDFTFRTCAKHEIEMAWLLLVGYPTETEEDFQETLNLLDKYQWINERGLVRSVALGPTLDIVPGSPLFKRHKDLGITWDEQNNWIYKDNNRVTRIKRWLRLKEKCLELGYPVVEKATDHLLMELEKYETMNPSTITQTFDQFSEIPGSMDRSD